MSENTRFKILLTHLITFLVSIPALMIIGHFFPGEVAENQVSWSFGQVSVWEWRISYHCLFSSVWYTDSIRKRENNTMTNKFKAVSRNMLTAFSLDTQILHRCRQEKGFSKDYEKDIFAVFAYEFELLHNRSFLVKSFAYAHGEIIYSVNCEIWCCRIKWN